VAAVRYCSACGAGLPATPPVTCPACGTEHWRNAKPCANGIVVEEGRVLLVRRALAPWQGAWCSPGGFCDPGEHPIQTVEREVLEETGLRVEVTGYLGVWVDSYSDGDPDAETINVGYYLAAPLHSAAITSRESSEVSDVSWFAWDELPEDLAPPGTLESVVTAARAALADGLPRLYDRL
jgi:ADP-ribose pyrophosphatase YjhB (NUDIX family)